MTARPLRVGIGGPVGSGKTALLLHLCRRMRSRYRVAVVTNDIYTREDAEFLVRHDALAADRIVGVETGGCPHTAIREDASINLAAVDELCTRLGPLDVVFVESGGDNLSATFSPELSDLTIYVIDVSAGDKIPRKGGSGDHPLRPAGHQQDRPRPLRRGVAGGHGAGREADAGNPALPVHEPEIGRGGAGRAGVHRAPRDARRGLTVGRYASPGHVMGAYPLERGGLTSGRRAPPCAWAGVVLVVVPEPVRTRAAARPGREGALRPPHPGRPAPRPATTAETSKRPCPRASRAGHCASAPAAVGARARTGTDLPRLHPGDVPLSPTSGRRNRLGARLRRRDTPTGRTSGRVIGGRTYAPASVRFGSEIGSGVRSS